MDNPNYSVPRKTDSRPVLYRSYIKKMDKKQILGNKYVPEYARDYFSKPWYERDLMGYFDHLAYQEMSKQPTEYFKKKR